MKEKRKGSLTVEAALSLSLMLLAFLSWTMVLQLVKIQSMMSYALDQTLLYRADQLCLENVLAGEEGGLKKGLLSQAGLGGEEINRSVEEIRSNLSLLEEVSGDQWARQTFLDFLGAGESDSWRWNVEHWIASLNIGTSYEPANQRLMMELHYEMALPGLMKIFGPLTIRQQAETGVWLLYPDRARGKGEGEEGNGEEEGGSVWQKSPFVRGRILVDRVRRGENACLPGQGFDFLSSDGRLVELVSLNLFSTSYSREMGGGRYEIRQQALAQQLEKYGKKIRKDQASYPDIRMENGSTVSSASRRLQLLLILPEEAGEYEEEVRSLSQPLAGKYGISFDFRYMEKAFPEKKGGGISNEKEKKQGERKGAKDSLPAAAQPPSSFQSFPF